jgi:hypothetical protein
MILVCRVDRMISVKLLDAESRPRAGMGPAATRVA